MRGLGARTGECQQQSRFGSLNHALVALSIRKQLTASCDPCCSPLAACSMHSSNMAAVRRLTGAGMARDCTACHLETRRRSRCKLLDEALKLSPPPLNTANHHSTPNSADRYQDTTESRPNCHHSGSAIQPAGAPEHTSSGIIRSANATRKSADQYTLLMPLLTVRRSNCESFHTVRS